ncbi:MAG: type II toxin-antitoxin system VapC family toxin [Acidobacteriota bacterium]|nr:type II toxin-antitoxin system VapC family toxin [Acidobacteriota bacterium]
MIIPDINLLVYSYNSDGPFHEDAKDWWEHCLSNPGAVGLPWTVILGFVRIMSSNAVFSNPMETRDAISEVQLWLACPQTQIVTPGPRHLEILTDIMGAARASGRLTTDAHLAALAIETQSELHSNDVDFARFRGLRWKNPIG